MAGRDVVGTRVPNPAARPGERATNGLPAPTSLRQKVILAASQAPSGIRLSHLAVAIDAPVSSVSRSLQSLIDAGLLRSTGTKPPRYALSQDHPALESLVHSATLALAPDEAIAILLRANPAVVLAVADSAGFLAVTLPDDGSGCVAGLDRRLALIRSFRPTSPPVRRASIDEFRRLLKVDLLTRHRLGAAIPLVNRLAHLSPVTSDTSPAARDPRVSRPRH